MPFTVKIEDVPENTNEVFFELILDDASNMILFLRRSPCTAAYLTDTFAVVLSSSNIAELIK